MRPELHTEVLDLLDAVPAHFAPRDEAEWDELMGQPGDEVSALIEEVCDEH